MAIGYYGGDAAQQESLESEYRGGPVLPNAAARSSSDITTDFHFIGMPFRTILLTLVNTIIICQKTHGRDNGTMLSIGAYMYHTMPPSPV